MKLAFSNMAQKDDPGNSIAAKIQNIISKDHAESMGVLVNRCRPHKREQVEQILSAMVQAGAVEELITTNPTNGKEVKKYKLTQ
jgi:DNA-binding TFAR19-related protein (PDSD5 family)